MSFTDYINLFRTTVSVPASLAIPVLYLSWYQAPRDTMRNCGPFKSPTTERLYYFGSQADGSSNSTDPPLVAYEIDRLLSTTSEAPYGGVNPYGATNYEQLDAIACVQDGEIIHIACWITDGNLYYQAYDMENRAWIDQTGYGDADQIVFTPTDYAPNAWCDIVVRSDGSIVIAHSYEAPLDGGTPVESVGVSYRSSTPGASWTTVEVEANSTAGNSLLAGSVALGSADQTFIIYQKENGDDVNIHVLGSDNSLWTSNFPKTHLGGWGADTPYVNRAQPFTRLGTNRIAAEVSTSAGTYVLVFDEVTSDTALGTISESLVFAGAIYTAINSGLIIDPHALNYARNVLIAYNAGDSDLYFNSDEGKVGNWQTLNDGYPIDTGTFNNCCATYLQLADGYYYAIVNYADGNVDFFPMEAFSGLTLLEQEGFRFRNDDGDETGASWRQTQDTNDEVGTLENFRLRLLLNATGVNAAKGYKIEFKKLSEDDSKWRKVPLP